MRMEGHHTVRGNLEIKSIESESSVFAGDPLSTARDPARSAGNCQQDHIMALQNKFVRTAQRH